VQGSGFRVQGVGFTRPWLPAGGLTMYMPWLRLPCFPTCCSASVTCPARKKSKYGVYVSRSLSTSPPPLYRPPDVPIPKVSGHLSSLASVGLDGHSQVDMLVVFKPVNLGAGGKIPGLNNLVIPNTETELGHSLWNYRV